MNRVLVPLIVLFLLKGCAYPFSSPTMKTLDMELSPSQVMKSPESHKGKKILIGGEIIKVTNLKEGTVIEILEKSLDYLGYPLAGDLSAGRFLAFSRKFLDSAIYKEGRELTLVGEVKGAKEGKIGERDYRYLMVDIIEIRLWPKRRSPVYREYYVIDPYWRGPYWWRGVYPP